MYNVWATFRFKDFKRHLLERIFSSAQNKIGKVGIYDRILNTVINTVMGVAILDILKVGRGTAIISSVLSLGGVGTLVFSLASKELAEQLVGGLTLSTSERFYEGDYIELGDGTEGLVTKIGWTHTELRGE